MGMHYSELNKYFSISVGVRSSLLQLLMLSKILGNILQAIKVLHKRRSKVVSIDLRVLSENIDQINSLIMCYLPLNLVSDW
jgi:hypothetical protein